jgi:predicted metal-dependent hydrolase
MHRIVIIFIVLTLIIIYSEILTENFEIIKQIASDNKFYYVQNFEDNKDAADILSGISKQCSSLVENLTVKYPQDTDVIRLQKKFNPDNMREAEDSQGQTSYTINKGEMMHLCLRHKNKDKALHDHNLLMFVAIHELAHIMSKSIGHNQEFYKNFKFLLTEAVEAGIYSPVNFHNNPVNYCGVNVTNNPYFE